MERDDDRYADGYGDAYGGGPPGHRSPTRNASQQQQQHRLQAHLQQRLAYESQHAAAQQQLSAAAAAQLHHHASSLHPSEQLLLRQQLDRVEEQQLLRQQQHYFGSPGGAHHHMVDSHSMQSTLDLYRQRQMADLERDLQLRRQLLLEQQQQELLARMDPHHQAVAQAQAQAHQAQQQQSLLLSPMRQRQLHLAEREQRERELEREREIEREQIERERERAQAERELELQRERQEREREREREQREREREMQLERELRERELQRELEREQHQREIEREKREREQQQRELEREQHLQLERERDHMEREAREREREQQLYHLTSASSPSSHQHRAYGALAAAVTQRNRDERFLEEHQQRLRGAFGSILQQQHHKQHPQQQHLLVQGEAKPSPASYEDRAAGSTSPADDVHLSAQQRAKKKRASPPTAAAASKGTATNVDSSDAESQALSSLLRSPALGRAAAAANRNANAEKLHVQFLSQDSSPRGSPSPSEGVAPNTAKMTSDILQEYVQQKKQQQQQQQQQLRKSPVAKGIKPPKGVAKAATASLKQKPQAKQPTKPPNKKQQQQVADILGRTITGTKSGFTRDDLSLDEEERLLADEEDEDQEQDAEESILAGKRTATGKRPFAATAIGTKVDASMAAMQGHGRSQEQQEKQLQLQRSLMKKRKNAEMEAVASLARVVGATPSLPPFSTSSTADSSPETTAKAASMNETFMEALRRQRTGMLPPFEVPAASKQQQSSQAKGMQEQDLEEDDDDVVVILEDDGRDKVPVVQEKRQKKGKKSGASPSPRRRTMVPETQPPPPLFLSKEQQEALKDQEENQEKEDEVEVLLSKEDNTSSSAQEGAKVQPKKKKKKKKKKGEGEETATESVSASGTNSASASPTSNERSEDAAVPPKRDYVRSLLAAAAASSSVLPTTSITPTNEKGNQEGFQTETTSPTEEEHTSTMAPSSDVSAAASALFQVASFASAEAETSSTTLLGDHSRDEDDGVARTPQGEGHSLAATSSPQTKGIAALIASLQKSQPEPMDLDGHQDGTSRNAATSIYAESERGEGGTSFVQKLAMPSLFGDQHENENGEDYGSSQDEETMDEEEDLEHENNDVETGNEGFVSVEHADATPSNDAHFSQSPIVLHDSSDALPPPIVDDSWWPSNSSIRRERLIRGYEVTGSDGDDEGEEDDEDEDDEDFDEDDEWRSSANHGSSAKRKYRRQRRRRRRPLPSYDPEEPGVLEKTPHCRLHTRWQRKLGSSSSPPKALFCFQVTEIYPTEVMVCCSICSTWRHAACGGHHRFSNSQGTINPRSMFTPVCDICFEEKKILQRDEDLKKALERQREVHLRRTLATTQVVRQAAFAKHSGTYKWPLGSVSNTHIGGHTRSVNLRHEKAEKQWSDMLMKLGSAVGYRPKERMKVRAKELERLMLYIDDAEIFTDRHNMILFLQHDTSKEHPAGYERQMRNFFDPADDVAEELPQQEGHQQLSKSEQTKNVADKGENGNADGSSSVTKKIDDESQSIATQSTCTDEVMDAEDNGDGDLSVKSTSSIRSSSKVHSTTTSSCAPPATTTTNAAGATGASVKIEEMKPASSLLSSATTSATGNVKSKATTITAGKKGSDSETKGALSAEGVKSKGKPVNKGKKQNVKGNDKSMEEAYHASPKSSNHSVSSSSSIGSSTRLSMNPGGESDESSDAETYDQDGKSNTKKSSAVISEVAPCCVRTGCSKKPRFDSLFCSDSCGVSALEVDLLRTLESSADIHPSLLR